MGTEIKSEDRGAARHRRRLTTAIKESLRELSIQLSLLNHHVSGRLELNDVDLDCLDLISRHGPLSPSALARRAGLHPATITGILDRLERGGWVRLRFVNASYRLHPIHLHGMYFRLLARNGAPVDEPFFRDTVLVHSQETIDIGLVPLDPGKWMMHCHILEHAEAGMMTLFEVRG